MDDMTLIVKVQELKDQMKVMAAEMDELRYQRDIARANLRRHVPQATPEEEQEMKRAFEDAPTDTLTELIAELVITNSISAARFGPRG